MSARLVNMHNLTTAPTVTKSLAKVILVEMFEGGLMGPREAASFISRRASSTANHRIFCD